MSSPTVLYLIEILHQTTTNRPCCRRSGRCILSKFYIKPQRITPDYLNYQGCILSKFYIKPQQRHYVRRFCVVVSYRNSTSNHNRRSPPSVPNRVVSYRNSTSNHNFQYLFVVISTLYLIEILHQTTTPKPKNIHIQRCILSKFYIKPQHCV